MKSQSANKLLEDFFSCPICLDTMQNPVTTKCGHNFCLNCIKKNNSECAVCRKTLDRDLTINYQMKNSIEAMKSMEKEESVKKFSNLNSNYKSVIKSSIPHISELSNYSNGGSVFSSGVKSRESNQNNFNNSNFNQRPSISMSENPKKWRMKRLFNEMNSFSEEKNIQQNNFQQTYYKGNNDNENVNNNLNNNQNYYHNFTPNPKVNIDKFLNNIMFDFKNPYANNNVSGMSEIGSNPTPVQNNFNNISINVYNVVDNNANSNLNSNLNSTTQGNFINNMYEYGGMGQSQNLNYNNNKY